MSALSVARVRVEHSSLYQRRDSGRDGHEDVTVAIVAVFPHRSNDDYLLLPVLIATLIVTLIITAILTLVLPSRVVVLAEALRVVVVLVLALKARLAGRETVPVLAAA